MRTEGASKQPRIAKPGSHFFNHLGVSGVSKSSAVISTQAFSSTRATANVSDNRIQAKISAPKGIREMFDELVVVLV